MQVVDKYGNTFGQGHLVITTKSGKSKLPVVTVAWGNITGVLANQTDLQDALDLKVPTSRTLTINGVTQDLSADRTWTISTGITVNTTPITGGTSGRLLFDNAGTVGETDGAHWDTSGFLGIGTTIPVAPIGYNGITINSATNGAYTWFQTGGVTKYSIGTEGNVNYHNLVAGTSFLIRSGGNNYFNLVQSTGNVQIGTTTDAGYKLDVNGTAAIRGITNIIGGTFRIASTGTLTQPSYITSHSDGGWNYTTYTHERGAGVHYFTSNNGSASIFSASAREGVNINVSSLTTGNPFSISGTVNASSAIARGQLINTTLVAAANNDVLIGLDVLPTFTNGAFTGVQNYAARFGGNILFTTANRTISVATPTVTSGGGSLTIKAGDAFTSGTGGSIFINEGLGAGGPGRGSINIGTLGYTAVNLGGYITISNSGPNTGSVLQVNAGGQNGLNIYWDNLTPFMQYGLVVNRQARFVNSSSYSFSTNLIIGATVNAGYMLDVNGTARIKGNSLTLSASGLSTPPANYIAVNFDDSPNHHQNWFAINSKKDISGIGTSYDRIIFPTMGSDNSTWQFNALGTYSRIQIAARNNSVGNYLDLTNSSISLSGPWTVVSIDRSNRKLIFGDMSTDVHHLSVYDLVIKGAKPFENNYGNSNGGNVYLVGGTPSTTPAGNYGNVILAHDSTAARGNVLIGTSTNVPSAVVNVNSTTQGFLPPRMTNAQMLAIATPSEGLVVYDLTNRKLCCYDGATWQPLF